MTLKEALDRVLAEAGFLQLSSYASNTDAEAQQLVALANREANRLSKHPWNKLRKTWALSMTSATSYALPADYRQFVPDTAWSETDRGEFPVTSEVWSYYNARGIDSGLLLRMRLTDGEMQIQNPDNGQVVNLEYISKYPIEDAAEAAKERFTADTDVWLLDDDLLTQGILWRFRQVKGLDWQVDFQEYRSMYNRERASDGGSRTVNIGNDGDYEPNGPVMDLYV
jgi:hypothetical protein